MNTNFIVFGLTRQGIEPESTASVADAISTRPLIGLVEESKLLIKVFVQARLGSLVTLRRIFALI